MDANHDSFIHKFPPEIASHIFMQFTPPNVFLAEDMCDRERLGNSPLYLGAVCQKWRQLAWTTPALWISLCVKLREDNDQCRLVAEWLERSASLPLTIRVEDHVQGWTYGDNVKRLICILNTHSARWHELQLNIPAQLLHHFSGSSPENSLRRLVLWHCFSYARTSEFATFSMKNKPSLTDLTLRIIELSFVGIIWDNLTVVSLDSIGVGDCLELIRRAPLLEALTLDSIRPFPKAFPFPNTRIVHLCLRPFF